MKAIKKPIQVNAWQLPRMGGTDFYQTQKTIRELNKLVPQSVFEKTSLIFDDQEYRVNTLEGTMKAKPGDYIIQGNNDDVWVVQREIFEDTYEVVD